MGDIIAEPQEKKMTPRNILKKFGFHSSATNLSNSREKKVMHNVSFTNTQPDCNTDSVYEYSIKGKSIGSSCLIGKEDGGDRKIDKIKVLIIDESQNGSGYEFMLNSNQKVNVLKDRLAEKLGLDERKVSLFRLKADGVDWTNFPDVSFDADDGNNILLGFRVKED